MRGLRVWGAGAALVGCALLAACGGSAGTGGGNDSAGRYTAGPGGGGGYTAGPSSDVEPSGGQTRTATGTEDPYPGASGKRHKQGVGWVSLYPVDSSSPSTSETESPPTISSPGDSPTPEDSSSATLQAAPAYPSVLYLWFDALAHKDCPNVLTEEGGSEGTLVSGLHAVCPAVLPDGQADWGTGEAAYDALAPTGGVPDGDCGDRSAYQLLKNLVELHRAYPDADFYVDDADKGGLSCPDQP